MCRVEDDQPAVTDSNDKRKRQIDAGKEAAIEAEVKAARERAVIPLEIRMKQFRDMLAEKEVRAYMYESGLKCIQLNTPVL